MQRSLRQEGLAQIRLRMEEVSNSSLDARAWMPTDCKDGLRPVGILAQLARSL